MLLFLRNEATNFQRLGLQFILDKYNTDDSTVPFKITIGTHTSQCGESFNPTVQKNTADRPFYLYTASYYRHFSSSISSKSARSSRSSTALPSSRILEHELFLVLHLPVEPMLQ